MKLKLTGLLALGLLACVFPQGEAPKRAHDYSALFPMITDPSFEVLSDGGCGSALGYLVSESENGQVFACTEVEEREAPNPFDPSYDEAEEKKKLEKLTARGFDPLVVENVIHWTLRSEQKASGNQKAEVVDTSFEFEVDYKIRGAVKVGNGEFLVLGEWGPRRPFGSGAATYLDYWVVDSPHGPGLSEDLWLPMWLRKEYRKPTTSMGFPAGVISLNKEPCDRVQLESAPRADGKSLDPGPRFDLSAFRKRAFVGSAQRQLHLPGDDNYTYPS